MCNAVVKGWFLNEWLGLEIFWTNYWGWKLIEAVLFCVTVLGWELIRRFERITLVSNQILEYAWLVVLLEGMSWRVSIYLFICWHIKLVFKQIVASRCCWPWHCQVHWVAECLSLMIVWFKLIHVDIWVFALSLLLPSFWFCWLWFV